MSEYVPLVGEPLIETKPWLRKVGGQVIRYMRDSIEDPTLQGLRRINPEHPELPKLLKIMRRNVIDELADLRSSGVVVPETRVRVTQIPRFKQGQKHAQEVKLGLETTTPLVNGIPMREAADTVNPDKYMSAVITSYDGLRRYVEACFDDERPFLSDVIGPSQYLFDGERLVMVDVDPLFSVTSDDNYRHVMQRIDMAEHTLLESLL